MIDEVRDLQEEHEMVPRERRDVHSEPSSWGHERLLDQGSLWMSTVRLHGVPPPPTSHSPEDNVCLRECGRTTVVACVKRRADPRASSYGTVDQSAVRPEEPRRLLFLSPPFLVLGVGHRRRQGEGPTAFREGQPSPRVARDERRPLIRGRPSE